MGTGILFSCTACKYSKDLSFGVGMMYSPNAVFYGRCNDATQNWSVAFPNGYCENDNPLLLSLVKEEKTKEKAFGFLSKGAKPDGYKYGHEAYICPKCKCLETRFYFRLKKEDVMYEPDYRCEKCVSSLKRTHFLDTNKKVIENIQNIDYDGISKVFICYYENDASVIWNCPDCDNDHFKGEISIHWD